MGSAARFAPPRSWKSRKPRSRNGPTRTAKTPISTFPAHRVWQLESAARNPVVTQWLAAEAGCALLHLPPGGLPDAWADDLAVVMREVADVVRQVAGDLADGRIDRPGEAIREIDEAMGALAALRVRMKTELDRKESGA